MSSRQRFISAFSVLALSCVLAACKDDAPSSSAGGATVYRSAGMKQCEQGGLSDTQSAALLASAGVQASRSGCGMLTGVMYPAVCGGATGDIVLHEIASSDLPAAMNAGYESVQLLARAGEGRGYDWIDCETRAAQP